MDHAGPDMKHHSDFAALCGKWIQKMDAPQSSHTALPWPGI